MRRGRRGSGGAFEKACLYANEKALKLSNAFEQRRKRGTTLSKKKRKKKPFRSEKHNKPAIESASALCFPLPHLSSAAERMLKVRFSFSPTLTNKLKTESEELVSDCVIAGSGRC